MQQYLFTKTPVAVARLEAEIKASGIGSGFSYMNYFDSSLEIYFENALSEGDETTLNSVVDAHTGVPSPSDVTPRQIRQALIISGVSMESIEAALDTLPEPQKSLAKIEWEYSTMFVRDRPLVVAVGTMLGWTPQQLDDLWAFASTL